MLINVDYDALMEADLLESVDADWDLLEADIPAVIQQAAQDLCSEYDGLVLDHIKTESPTIYVAWYTDTTLHPEDDGYRMFREFHLINGEAVDIHAA